MADAGEQDEVTELLMAAAGGNCGSNNDVGLLDRPNLAGEVPIQLRDATEKRKRSIRQWMSQVKEGR